MDPTDPPSHRDDPLAFLLGRVDYERAQKMPYRSRRFKLDRMRQLLAELGNPHHALKIVHIAGTKGKGSTAAMLSTILGAAGYRTGLYTSPHLHRLQERFVIEGQPCCPSELAQLLADVRRVSDVMDRCAEAGTGYESGPTYFEITTAMAFLHFARRAVDLAVVEVGLGGRLDSTNVCQPLVSVITSISLDHTQQLGHTLAAIAGEKAGIIRPGTPVVSGVTTPEPADVIRRTAQRHGCPLLALGRDFDFCYQLPSPATVAAAAAGETAADLGRMDYWRPAQAPLLRRNELSLGLLGHHQAANAAVALATLGCLENAGWPVPESAIRAGLREARCPARIELASARPTVVIDAAHNLASIEALLEVLDRCFSPSRRWALFATSRDKDAAGMLRRLLPKFDEVILTRFCHNPRSTPPEQLAAAAQQAAAQLARQGLPTPRLRCSSDPASAWREARREAGPDDLICVTGSFFLAAEIRELVRPSLCGDPLVAAPL